MGWTGTYKPQGQSIKDFLVKEFGFDREDSRCTLLDLAVVERTTAYGAVRTVLPPNEAEGFAGREEVWGLVVLLQYGRGQYNIYYKDIDENMGPCEDRCPERILKLLTPRPACTKEDCAGCCDCWASRWRERCWANLEAAKQLKAKQPKVKDGDIIKLAHPVRFSNGEELDTFTIRKYGRKVRLQNYYTTYRLNLRKYPYEILEAA